MKKNSLYICLLLAGSINYSFAQEPVDTAMMRKIREEGLNHSQVMNIAFYLTDVSGPRLSGSPGLKRAQDWAVHELIRWGLVNAQRESWGKFGKGWEVQKNYAAITAPYYHALIAIPKAWTPGTNGPITSNVVLIKVDSLADLANYKGTLSGKIILTDVKANDGRSFKPDANRYADTALNTFALAQPEGKTNNPFDPKSPQMAERRRLQALNNQINALLKEENVALRLSRARGSDGTVFTTNGASYADTAHSVVPELEVSSEDYQRILRLVKAGIKVNLEADIKTQFYTDDLNGYNVVAEIPGTDKKLKDQVVMLGGHLDSWHAGTGATDNAAGSAVVMEAVRILKALNVSPRRTIRIALWSSEEQGLFGSLGYVRKHFGDPQTTLLPEQAKISAYYNLDNGAGKIRGIYLQGNAAVRTLYQSWLAPFNDLGAATVTIRNTGSTDHISFDAVGIPAFQFLQDPLDYGTRTHHSNQDTFEKLDQEDLSEAAVIMAAFIYNTAQRDEMIPRK